jgi:CubicO group peptidase (beta-lactamase class C family)
MLGFRPHWGMGVLHNEIGVYGPNPKAFGHSGWGGSFGCADRESQIAVGYVMNQMGPDLVGDPRGAMLASAVFECAQAS